MYRALASALTVAIAVTSNAVAADQTVFGIQLGEPLSLPECERTGSGYSLLVKAVCFESLSAIPSSEEMRTIRIRFPLNDSPNLVSGGVLLAQVIGGRLEGVGFNTAGLRNQEAALTALKQKYGEPRALVPKTVKNRLGASFETFDALWETPEIQVTFQSVASSLDSGLVNIDTRKGKEVRDRRLKELLKDRRPL
jgi:hypothetical protein